MTKSAQRKAARLARKQSKKGKEGPSQSSEPEPAAQQNGIDGLPNGDTSPSGSKAHPVEILESAPEVRGSDVAVNGHVSHPLPDPEPVVPLPVTSSNGPPAVQPAPDHDNILPQTSQNQFVKVLELEKSEIADEPVVEGKLDPDSRAEQATAPVESVKAAKEAESAKKRQSFIERTLWTFVMIGGFLREFN